MNEVVISGIGVICSIARDYQQMGKVLSQGVCGIGPLSLWQSESNCPVAQVDMLKQTGHSFRTLALAEIAMEQALKDANLFRDEMGPNAGISFSTCTMGMLELEQNFFAFRQGEKTFFDYSSALSAGYVGNTLAENYGIEGPVISFSTACSSSANAIAHAYHLIKTGQCDLVLTGGADALCRLTYHGFQSLKVMSDSPCIPFDTNRKGMNIGEGAGILVLESAESAYRRGVPIRARVVGVGMSADAYHMSAPEVSGIGAQIAMRRALDNAGLNIADIDFISAHGTATKQNDRSESVAIRTVFGNCADQVLVHGVKSYIGHTLGVAGVLATIVAVYSLENQFLPPTLRLETPDIHCPVKHVTPENCRANFTTGLVNAFAFGGNNASLIITKNGKA